MGVIQRFKDWRYKRKEKWHIIDNHHDLPIGKYMECIDIAKSEIDGIDKATAILRVLTGWSEQDIENLSVVEYSALASGCGWLYEQVAVVDTKKQYKVGEFILCPSDADSITTAQYIDFQTFVVDADKYIIEMLSALLVPKGMRYNAGYSIKDVQKSIRNYLPTDDAISLVAFFLAKCQQSIADTRLSLDEEIKRAPAKTKEQKEMKKKAVEMLANMQRSGDGY